MAEKKLVIIRKDKDFKRAYARGRSFVSSLVVLHVNKNFGKGTRFGITTSKKVGNAIRRNRARRVIRQACVEFAKDRTFGDFDFVLTARAATPAAKSYDVKRCIRDLFRILKQYGDKRRFVRR